MPTGLGSCLAVALKMSVTPELRGREVPKYLLASGPVCTQKLYYLNYTSLAKAAQPPGVDAVLQYVCLYWYSLFLNGKENKLYCYKATS